MSKPTVSSLEDVSAELTKQPNVNTQVVNPGLDEEEWAFLQSIDEKHEDKIYHKVSLPVVQLIHLLMVARSIAGSFLYLPFYTSSPSLTDRTLVCSQTPACWGYTNTCSEREN